MHQERTKFPVIASLAAALALSGGTAGCGSGSPAADPADASVAPPDARTFQPRGDHHQYVLDEVILPTGGSAAALGFDLDDSGLVDNRLAEIVDTLNAVVGQDLQENLTAQVDSGGVIMLANIQAASLASSEDVGLWILRGANPQPAPCASTGDPICRLHLQGDGQFAVATEAPEESFIGGTIAGGTFSGLDFGSFSIDIPVLVGRPPVTANVIGARAVMRVGGRGLVDGRLGGAITESEVAENLIPQLHALMSEAVADDCEGTEPPDCCVPGTVGDQLIGIFDADGSCDLSLEEVRDNALVRGLLAPDVDLLDGEGFYRPNEDGVKESISLGVGFQAVPAGFAPPGD